MSKKLTLLTCLMLLFSLISTSAFSSNIANASSVENINLNSNEKYEVEYLENTDVYQKIKFTNKETGEVEYLEADFTKENPEYHATYTDQQTKQQTEVLITTVEESMITTNLTTNETKTEKIFNLEDSIQPFGLPGGNGDYELRHTFHGSKQLSGNGTISLVAGILASVYGGPVTGVIVSIATYLISAGAPVFYYIHELYFYKGVPNKPAAFVRYYEKSNYTGYLGAEYDNFIW